MTDHYHVSRNFALHAGSKSSSPIWALQSHANSPLAVFQRSGSRMQQGTAVNTPRYAKAAGLIDSSVFSLCFLLTAFGTP